MSVSGLGRGARDVPDDGGGVEDGRDGADEERCLLGIAEIGDIPDEPFLDHDLEDARDERRNDLNCNQLFSD